LTAINRCGMNRRQCDAPDRHWVVDKMPSNLARVDLIHAVLPRARIVHARRDKFVGSSRMTSSSAFCGVDNREHASR
jgi:hypothetical protein